MAQKGSKKRFITIDEEKDAFLSFVNKKIRNARKKLEQIDDLEKKDRSTLKPEQLDKIKSRAETHELIKTNEGLKDLYYQALKTAQEEGKALPQQESQVPRKATTEEDKTEQPRVVEEPKQQIAVEPQDNSRIIRDTLSKALNLVHFAQLFRDQNTVQAFRHAYESHRDQFSLESLPDFESFHEFFVKVFTFSESDRFGKVGDKINRSLGELESYINGAEQPALRNKTYRHLQHVVESVAGSAFFRDRNAEVEAPKARTHTEPSAIGSELRKAPEHQEAPVEARPVVRSPEKETRAHPEAATRTAEKAAPQEEARKDWGSLEDEEEEEPVREEEKGEAREEEEEEPVKKEEQKDDDGFISVKSKIKERKEETGYRGSGTRSYRGGRGGNRGGERGGYRREYREGQEGQEGGYRRPRREEGQEGGEGQQGEGQGERRGGYRGRGEGRGGRGGYRGRGEGRGGYRGGYRREGEQQQQGERQAGNEGVRTENA